VNKAFVREADDVAPRCPSCGSPGLEVLRDTLAAQVPDEFRGKLSSDAAWYCPFDRCDVVYFDAFERMLSTAQIPAAVYPKDPAAPLCGCLGITAEDLERDLDEGTVERTRRCVRHAQSPDARCSLMNPSGRSCEAEVQRYYMQRRGERGGT
jgi:hypothetical protein